MPYSRPTLTALLTQVQQDITAAQITSPTIGNVLQGLLDQAVLLDVGNAEAGLTYELYGYLDWIARQSNPFTATDEYLFAWAALKGVYQKDAVAATGVFTVASGAVNGTPLPNETVINRSDGAVYTTTAVATVSGGAVSAPMIASVAGAAGTIVAGQAFSIATTISGIPSAGTGTPTTPGADQETQDSLRTRMLAAYAAPPQGGDRADYVQWAEAVSGVTRAWVAPNQMGAGTVSVYTMFDLAESAGGGFPVGSNGVSQFDVGPGGMPRDTVATGDQLTVANAISPLQPVTALVYSVAPLADPIAFAIGNLGAANTAANQAAITAALQDMFLRLGNVGGTTDPTTGEAWPTIDPSDWFAAISSVSGLGRFSVTSPASPISPATGYLPTLGAVTFAS